MDGRRRRRDVQALDDERAEQRDQDLSDETDDEDRFPDRFQQRSAGADAFRDLEADESHGLEQDQASQDRQESRRLVPGPARERSDAGREQRRDRNHEEWRFPGVTCGFE